MNVRVSVIILAAAIFMAVWDADQKAMENDRVQIARQRASQQALITEKTTLGSGKTPSDSAAAPISDATPTAAAAVSAAGSGSDCIPLPARLAAGTWQVTNDQGQESRITIHSAPAASETEQSFCIITTENGRRWCFVKLPDFSRSASSTNDSSLR